MTNQASADELEHKLMDLFMRSAEFGRVFLTSATKEEFAESIRAGALDHQEAAHEAMKLIRTEKLKLLAEVRERVVGEGELVDAEILKKFYDKAYSNGFDDKGYENSYNSQDYRSAEDIAPVIAKIRGGNEKRFAALTKLEAEL